MGSYVGNGRRDGVTVVVVMRGVVVKEGMSVSECAAARRVAIEAGG